MKRLILFILLITTLSINSYAITYAEVLNQIKSNNTELKALEAQIAAQGCQIKTNNNLSNPNISGAYLFGPSGLGNKYEFGVSQGFDWPGLYSARKKANNARIEALSNLYSQKKLEILIATQQICIDIVCYNRQICFDQNILQNLNSLYEKSLKGLEYGEISILDTNKLKIEIIAVNQSILDTKSMLQAKLKSLIGLNAGINIEGIDSLNDYPLIPLNSLQWYIDLMKSKDPKLAYISANIDADKKDINVANAFNLPKFDIGYRHVNELGEKFNGITLGISIPIFENRGKKKATKAQVIASEMALTSAMTSQTSDITAMHLRASSLSNQISKYREALSDCNNIAILNKALNGGQISLLNYLLELRYFIEAERALIEMEHEYNTILTELNKYSI